MDGKVHDISVYGMRRWALVIAIVLASAISVGVSQASAGGNFRYSGTYQYSGRDYGGHDYSGHDFRGRHHYGGHDNSGHHFRRRSERSHEYRR